MSEPIPGIRFGAAPIRTRSAMASGSRLASALMGTIADEFGKARGEIERQHSAHRQAGDEDLALPPGEFLQSRLGGAEPIEIAGGLHVVGRRAMPGQTRPADREAESVMQA